MTMSWRAVCQLVMYFCSKVILVRDFIEGETLGRAKRRQNKS